MEYRQHKTAAELKFGFKIIQNLFSDYKLIFFIDETPVADILLYQIGKIFTEVIENIDDGTKGSWQHTQVWLL